jgi:hypothetical protein
VRSVTRDDRCSETRSNYDLKEKVSIQKKNFLVISYGCINADFFVSFGH